MIPHSIIIDDFLSDFDGWRAWADTLEFKDEKNDADGVVYPLIYKNVPSWGVRNNLSIVLGSNIKINAIFMRLSTEGTPVPHYAHTDSVMGSYSCMVYLNRAEHCKGGTALLRHANGMDSDPRSQDEYEAWALDMNNREKWTPYSMCEMRANRAFIFRSDLFHAAIPFGGFGKDTTDGRLVLTAFFDLCK